MDDVIKNAVRKFDWLALSALLPSPLNAEGREEMESLLEEVTSGGHLSVLRPRGDLIRRRDAFCASLASHLGGVPEWVDLDLAVDAAVYNERLIELAFGEVMGCLARLVRPQLSPEAHVWAAVRYGEDQARLIHESVLAACASAAAGGGGVDLAALRIPVGEQGRMVDPDSQMQGGASVLTATLKMLAHENGWSDEPTGHILFPPPVETDFAALSAAHRSGRLADAYRNIRRSADHLRQFGGEATAATVLQSGVKEARANTESNLVVEFALPDGAAIAAQTAQERLRRFLLQGFMQMDAGHLVAPRVVAGGPTPMPPVGFVSEFEAFASVALSQLLYRRVYEHPIKYGGLTLAEWIRGYAFLKRFAVAIPQPSLSPAVATGTSSVAGDHAVRLDVKSFLAGLAEVGLPAGKGNAFLNAVTFGQRHDDVIDAPVLRCADGSLYLLPSFGAAANVPIAVASQLATFGADLSWKGKSFEDHLLRVLEAKGLEGRPVHRQIDGQEVEVDCVLVWNSVVFVIECKNHSLPDPASPKAISRFLGEQAKGMRQAKEKLDALRSHPEMMVAVFGRPISASRWVPVVLNGAPFSLAGSHEGVYIYDMSALGRFLESKYLRVRTDERPRGIGRAEGPALWAGEAPTADDLLAQLEDPLQHQIVSAKFAWEPEQVPMSETSLLITRVIRRLPGGIDLEIKAAEDQNRKTGTPSVRGTPS